MISNCANPECAAPLLRLRDGKLFQFEVRSISVPCVDETRSGPAEALNRQVAHYWLCGACAERMSLVLDVSTVQLVNAAPPQPLREPAHYASAAAH